MILIELEFNNFKTYVRNHVIKIDGKFIVVTGPNGAGTNTLLIFARTMELYQQKRKSNFMDAVAFVMGAKPADLRVSKMEELVNSMAPEAHGMFVKVVLQSENGDEHCFKRSIQRSRCRYHVNDKEVSFPEYENLLKTFNVNIKANNCLVFQNSVESIVTKRPSERTAMFEEMSGSGEFKQKYEQSEAELRRYYDAQQSLLMEKRLLARNIKNMRLYEQDAKIYAELSKQKENAEVQLLLFNLYHLKRMIQRSVAKETESKEIIDDLGNEKCSREKKLEQLQSDRQKYSEAVANLMETRRTKELKVKEVAKKLAQITSKKDYFEGRIGRYAQSYESAKKADETRRSYVQDLQDALKDVEREKVKYIHHYSNTLGRDVQLSDSQIHEYEDLKHRVEAACAANTDRLISLSREYEALKDIYDNERRKLNEAETSIELTRDLRNVITGRIEGKEDSIKKLQTELQIKRTAYEQLEATFELSKQREQLLERDVAKIAEELKDSEDDEFGMMRKKLEIVRKLKDRFPGVYERLGELCRPIHNRYHIAVTKVFGMNVDAIIVDDEKTAIKCIEYLKENRISVCTFLPLNQLQKSKLSEHLRDIREPPNVKLVYDVIQFSPAEISRAVFYATKNTLVCETPEDAQKVAYEMSNRHDCVALDGCYYRKSGIISGGNCDLARKAKRWDLQQRASLKYKKQSLISDLREVRKKAPKESDLLDLATAIKGIESSLQFKMKDTANDYKELGKIDNELKVREGNKRVLEKLAMDAKCGMNKAFEAVRESKATSDAIEAEAFADFCERIGVANIQNFEKEQKFYMEKIGEFDKQIDRIKSLLLFECKDTGTELEKCERNLKEERRRLRSIDERQTHMQSLLTAESNELETLQSEYSNSENLLGNIEEQITQCRSDIRAMAQEHLSLIDELNRIQLKIGLKKAKFLTLLKTAKLHGHSIVPTTDQTSSTSQSSDVSAANAAFDSLTDTREIESLRIDFSRLPEELIDLEDAELDSTREQLERVIAERAEEIAEIKDPDARVSQELTFHEEKLRKTINELRENRKIMKNISAAYDAVKEERSNRFTPFFDHVSSRVDAIYKQLTKNPAAQAYLIADNSEEPYRAGIQYACVVPGKQFHAIDNLSGGEKTMAALALLFALQSVQDKKPPFQIVDEIDAALDCRNVKYLLEYIQRNRDNQMIVISHNKEFVASADTVVGITSTKTDSRMESAVFTFDLTPYPDRITR